MNKATQFIRKHALAILVVAVALAVPFGVASAKYTTTATVTTDLTVKVEATYELDTTNLKTNLDKLINSNGTKPTIIVFVAGNNSEIAALEAKYDGVQTSTSQPIGTFVSADESTIYVAPMVESTKKPATSSTEKIYSSDGSALDTYFATLTDITVTKSNLEYYTN